jgi:hypothetical protein
LVDRLQRGEPLELALDPALCLDALGDIPRDGEDRQLAAKVDQAGVDLDRDNPSIPGLCWEVNSR